MRMREGFARWLGGLGGWLRRKQREAAKEIGERAAEPKTEAEAALWQAMGWTREEEEDAAAIARRKAGEALAGK